MRSKWCWDMCDKSVRAIRCTYVRCTVREYVHAETGLRSNELDARIFFSSAPTAVFCQKFCCAFCWLVIMMAIKNKHVPFHRDTRVRAWAHTGIHHLQHYQACAIRRSIVERQFSSISGIISLEREIENREWKVRHSFAGMSFVITASSRRRFTPSSKCKIMCVMPSSCHQKTNFGKENVMRPEA